MCGNAQTQRLILLQNRRMQLTRFALVAENKSIHPRKASTKSKQAMQSITVADFCLITALVVLAQQLRSSFHFGDGNGF
jgi:hypothetical protein